MDPEKTVYWTKFAATVNVEMEVFFEAASDEEAKTLAQRMAEDPHLMDELAATGMTDGISAAVMYEPRPHKHQSVELTPEVAEWCNSPAADGAEVD